MENIDPTRQLTEEEVYQEISNLLQLARDHITTAEGLAREYNLDFRWDGPEYGMGGFFDSDSGEWQPSSEQ